MNLVCLDTSVLIPLLRGDEGMMQRLKAAAEAGETVATTAINLCELYAGAYSTRIPQREVRRVDRLVSALVVLPLNEEASKKFGELANSDVVRHEPVGDLDLLIASVVSNAGESLATRNAKRFAKIEGLEVDEW